LVYLLIAAHIAHWRITGRTLAPLELSQVLVTLHLGVMTGGFILMAVIVGLTARYGRFFCGWGCHMLALQDGAAWLLRRFGAHPRPLRSRVLRAVPAMLVLYLFVWPPIGARVLGPADGPAEGASRVLAATRDAFWTDDFWRGLPGPGITVATFIFCGGLAVWALGTRGFCQYGCPWGALFAAVDRMAPGRVRLIGDCTQCGLCTAACSSHIVVHKEIAAFGRVRSSDCLKDLDCVSVCPTQGLSFGLAAPPSPAQTSRAQTSDPAARPSQPMAQDLLLGALWIALFLVFRGLYEIVPVLLAAGIALVLAAGALRSGEHFATVVRARKASGRQLVQIGVAGLVAIAVAHASLIRWHEFLGERAYAATGSGEAGAPESARAHLEFVDRWGVLGLPSVHARLATLALADGDAERATTELEQASTGAEAATTTQRAGLGRAWLALARLHEGHGSQDAALAAYGRAAALEPGDGTVWLAMGTLAVKAGRLESAKAAFHASQTFEASRLVGHQDLGVVLFGAGDLSGAKDEFCAALALDPNYQPALRGLDATGTAELCPAAGTITGAPR
jgi:polyferredoxin/cytochrome c-type biogenesis protein CcmH/NrfG